MTCLYRSKPTFVEAIQWLGFAEDTPDNVVAVNEFGGSKVRPRDDDERDAYGLELLAGKDGAQEWVPVPDGHWLVNQPGDKSDIWPVDPDYFAAKYEAVEDGYR